MRSLGAHCDDSNGCRHVHASRWRCNSFDGRILTAEVLGITSGSEHHEEWDPRLHTTWSMDSGSQASVAAAFLARTALPRRSAVDMDNSDGYDHEKDCTLLDVGVGNSGLSPLTMLPHDTRFTDAASPYRCDRVDSTVQSFSHAGHKLSSRKGLRVTFTKRVEFWFPDEHQHTIKKTRHLICGTAQAQGSSAVLSAQVERDESFLADAPP